MKYPTVRKYYLGHLVVCFTDKHVGTVVESSNECANPVGYHSTTWVAVDATMSNGEPKWTEVEQDGEE